MSPLPAPAPVKYDRVRSRCLFHFAASEGSLTPLTGQTPTFARASVGGLVYDAAARASTPLHSQPGFGAFDLDNDGVRETLALTLHGARTNLCLQSENFGTTWSAIGTPTRIAAAKVLGALSLDLIGDDAAGSLEGYSQTITFTGNGVKAVSLYVAQDTSTSAVIRILDSTAVANRLVAVLTWSAGAPSLVVGTGVYQGAEYVGAGVYRLHFQTSSITAANTNTLLLYPATDGALSSAPQGRVIMGGVQVENATFPSAYVKTTTGTVSRARDALSYAGAWAVQDQTWYAKFLRPLSADVVGSLGDTPGIMSLGSTGARIELYMQEAARTVAISATDAAAVSSATAQVMPAGAIIEVCAQIATVATGVKVRIDVGAGFSTYSTSAAAVSAWGNTTFCLGDFAAVPGNCLSSGLLIAKVLAGARTLDECRQTR